MGFDVGGPEAIIVLVIVLVLFGGSQIPKLARNLGRAQKEFKDGIDEASKPTSSITDTTAIDQEARDQQIREQAIRDQAIRDQAIRDQAIRDQALRDAAASSAASDVSTHDSNA